MDPAQARMMLIVMPVMFTVMFYQFASGLVLYWFVSNAARHRSADAREPEQDVSRAELAPKAQTSNHAPQPPPRSSGANEGKVRSPHVRSQIRAA